MVVSHYASTIVYLEIYVLKLLKINRTLIARFMILSHVCKI